jgi:hypothetical protein
VLLAIAKVVLILAVVVLAWLLLAGVVLDLFLRRAEAPPGGDEPPEAPPDPLDPTRFR